MNGVTVDMSEIGKLQTLLGYAETQVKTGMAPILDRVADSVVAEAKQIAPVDTGELVNSIAVTRRQGNNVNRQRWVGSPVRQAFFQEFGTSSMPPQPWLTPAAAAGIDRLATELGVLGDIW